MRKNTNKDDYGENEDGTENVGVLVEKKRKKIDRQSTTTKINLFIPATTINWLNCRGRRMEMWQNERKCVCGKNKSAVCDIF